MTAVESVVWVDERQGKDVGEVPAEAALSLSQPAVGRTRLFPLSDAARFHSL
jgi:hypothetical protein